MKILGINSHFEHPSATIIEDGKVLYAIEEERLTRVKHGKKYNPYKSFLPLESIYAALKFCNIHASKIDVIATSYSSKHHIAGLVKGAFKPRMSSFQEEISAYSSVKNLRRTLRQSYEFSTRHTDFMPKGCFKSTPIEEWDHHLAHAASAYYCSEFSESLVVVADGSGEYACTSIYIADEKNGLRKVKSFDLPNSLGFFYSFVTSYLGFEAFSDEYKVMGLAAYGTPRYENELSKVLKHNKNGGYSIDFKLLNSLESILGPKREPADEFNQFHKDVAASAQKLLEDVVLDIIKTYMTKYSQENLCLAGGVFLNVLCNEKISKHELIRGLYIQPASHDAGTAIGAASLSALKHGSEARLKNTSMFLGSSYENEEIESLLKGSKIPFKELTNGEIPGVLSKILHEGNIVAMYKGRMEFGPRALGNRSILASPTSKETKAKLNILKHREMYRPLAPLVLEEEFDTYFDGTRNEYMMITATAKDRTISLVPACVHNDGTARVQSVTKKSDQLIHDLLTKFKELSGVPILINTSFNIKGKPIDLTPSDAISSFFSSSFDFMLLGNYLISKGALTE